MQYQTANSDCRGCERRPLLFLTSNFEHLFSVFLFFLFSCISNKSIGIALINNAQISTNIAGLVAGAQFDAALAKAHVRPLPQWQCVKGTLSPTLALALTLTLTLTRIITLTLTES